MAGCAWRPQSGPESVIDKYKACRFMSEANSQNVILLFHLGTRFHYLLGYIGKVQRINPVIPEATGICIGFTAWK